MTTDSSVVLQVQPCWRVLQRAPVGVLYKHSPICGASVAAHREVSRFAAEHPAVPVCLIDVIRERSLAQTIAETLDVSHASPQVILVRAGVAVWVASHRAIRAEALAESLRSTEGGAGAVERSDDFTGVP